MTIYDDMRGYVHTHDRNGWFDVVAETIPMYQMIDKADAENAKLRERMELLTEILRNDHDIDASWDGLRHFWSIELTEDGCLMRDRACKAEAENAKLRERYYAYESKMDGLVSRLTGGLLSKSAATPNDALCSVVEEQMTDELVDENFELESENAKLREIIDDITEVVEVSDPALVEFIAKRMQRVRIEVTDD